MTTAAAKYQLKRTGIFVFISLRGSNQKPSKSAFYFPLSRGHLPKRSF
jgi:hypothetical protein